MPCAPSFTFPGCVRFCLGSRSHSLLTPHTGNATAVTEGLSGLSANSFGDRCVICRGQGCFPGSDTRPCGPGSLCFSFTPASGQSACQGTKLSEERPLGNTNLHPEGGVRDGRALLNLHPPPRGESGFLSLNTKMPSSGSVSLTPRGLPNLSSSPTLPKPLHCPSQLLRFQNAGAVLHQVTCYSLHTGCLSHLGRLSLPTPLSRLVRVSPLQAFWLPLHPLST